MTTDKLTEFVIVDKQPHELLPGEMALYIQDNHWYIGCPQCYGLGTLAGHAVTKSGDTITVSPSVLCGCGAHYFIENNKIRWC